MITQWRIKLANHIADTFPLSQKHELGVFWKLAGETWKERLIRRLDPGGVYRHPQQKWALYMVSGGGYVHGEFNTQRISTRKFTNLSDALRKAPYSPSVGLQAFEKDRLELYAIGQAAAKTLYDVEVYDKSKILLRSDLKPTNVVNGPDCKHLILDGMIEKPLPCQDHVSINDLLDI